MPLHSPAWPSWSYLTMIRAAIYARFSSDRQNDKSVDDQIAFCREICAREGFAVAMSFDDREISGASTQNRPGFQALMQSAAAGLFEAIVAEDMDRLFRDQADYHIARKRLDFIGIAIHTAGGKVGRLDGSMRALMGEMFLDNLAVHTRRGLEAVIRAGRHAGGRAYGYRAVPGKPGELTIEAREAEIVRRIFRDYLAGRTPRAIAAALNAERVPPPRGPRWNASTIHGNSARGHGLLLNALYAGRIVWNKVRMLKDPATGRRISRPNPPDQHRSTDAPQLAIVEVATFEAAQARRAGRSRQGASRSRSAVRPLSGLLRCGACGAGMSALGAQRPGKPHRVQCSAFRESGACNNGRKVSRGAIEALVFEGLREELAHPDAIAEYVRAYNAERRRLAKTSGDREKLLARRDGELEREIKRLAMTIARGGDFEVYNPLVDALAAERKAVQAELALIAASSEVVAVHPAAIERYLADIQRLADVAAEAATIDAPELVATLRQLVQTVIVHAPAGTSALTIEIKASLSELTLPGPLLKRSGGRVIDGSGGAIHAFPPPLEPLYIVIRRERKAA